MIMADGPMARLFWQALDEVDYRIMQARLGLWDVLYALCGPKSSTMPDEWRKLD
jgi:hypothetical protein